MSTSAMFLQVMYAAVHDLSIAVVAMIFFLSLQVSSHYEYWSIFNFIQTIVCAILLIFCNYMLSNGSGRHQARHITGKLY